MNSLIDLLADQLSGNVADQMSNQLGADKNATQTAIAAAIPMLMGALSRNATSKEGAQSLANALERDHDGSVLNDLVGYVNRGGNLQDGDGILRHTLGDRRNTVEQGVSKASGLDLGTVSKLLPMLAPIVMGMLGKTKREANLDAAGMASVLGGERRRADSALGGLAGLLDADGDGSIVDDVAGIGSRLLGGFLKGRR